MVVFNPQIQPTNIPDYSRTSKDVTPVPYDGDKSAGVLLNTLSTGIESGTKLAESTMEDYLKEKVSAGVDALRDTSVLAYQDIRNSQITGTAPSEAAVATAGFKGSLVKGGSDPEVPEALQAGLDRAENIGIAKSQKGGANDTLYTAQLYALTKQLRAEYPGHKDFIDETIAKVSGKNPANAYMSNLLADINHASTGQDVFQKMILSKAATHMGEADVQKYLLAAQQNLPGAMGNLTDAVFRAEGVKAQNERWKVDHEQNQGNQADAATKATGQAELRAQQIIDQHLEPVVKIPGLTDTPTMRKLVDDSVTGKISLDPTQKDQLVQMLTMARSHADEDMQSKFDKEGYSGIIRNPKTLEDIRTSKLSYFDRSIAAIKDEKFGTFFEDRRRNQADQDSTNRQINVSDIGQDTRVRARLTEALGPSWMNYIDSASLGKNYLGRLQTFTANSMGRATVPDDIRKDGVVGSMYSDLAAVKKAKDQGVKVPDKAYDDLTDNVKLLLKAKEEGREDIAKQVVKYTFDPAKNQRIVEMFGKGFTDGNGVTHNGREAVYDTLTQPKIVDSIWGLKDPKSWQMHKEWQEISFKTIFGEEVKDLDRKMNWKQTDSKLNWDSDNNRFFLSGPSVDKSRKIDPGVPPTALPADVANVRIAESTLNTLNRGLGNLAYMRKTEGNDVNSYLWDMLTTMGYSPNDRLHGDNLPQRIIEAVHASSKSNKARIEDAFKASRGD